MKRLLLALSLTACTSLHAEVGPEPSPPGQARQAERLEAPEGTTGAGRSRSPAAALRLAAGSPPAGRAALRSPSVTNTAPTADGDTTNAPLSMAAAASPRVAAAEAEAEGAAADLALTVKTAYVDVLLVRELQALDESLVETAKQFRDAAQKRFDAGDVPRVEVDRATLEVARAEQELLRAQTHVRVREATLNELLGRPLDAPLQLTDKLEFKPADLGEEDLVAVALRQRPELRAAQAELTALQAEVRVAGAERRPDLEVQAKRNEIESGGDNALMLVVSAPLLDYGAIRHEVAAAKADAARQQAAVEALRRQVRLEVGTARTELTQAEARVKRYEQTLLPTTDRVTQTIRRGFDAGASTMLDVLDAQRTLRSVQTEYRQAVADYLRAEAKLQWAVGGTAD